MPSTHKIRLLVPATAANERSDIWLARETGLSRSRVRRLIESGAVLLNNEPLRSASRETKPGMSFSICIPEDTENQSPLPEEIELVVIYEDQHIIAINKPAGLVVHPASGHPGGTLVNAILNHCGDLGDVGDPARPGIVHRLDRDTSGVMVVAKTAGALLDLQQQFQKDETVKVYRALVYGLPRPEAGRIENYIGRSPRDRKRMAVLGSGGKRAVSHYKVLQSFAGEPQFSHLEVRIETGRTHQIRVHMRHLGCPVIGDPMYGSRRKDKTLSNIRGCALERQMLHSSSLSLRHPATGELICFEAPPPEDFLRVLTSLEKRGPANEV